MILKLRARIKPISPFVQPITIESTAMGFREEVPRGPLTGEYGLADPSPNPSSSSSSSSSTGTALELVPYTSENPNINCIPNFTFCVNTQNNECPNLNVALPSGRCACTSCNSNADPGWERSAY